MRIVSLVPSATEMLFALGLGADVTAVTHECDFPPEAAELPTVTRDVLPAGLSPAEVDAAVEERTAHGEAIYELDREALADAEPDLIVTQGLCAVCAVSVDDVRAVAEELPTRPRVLSLDPRTLGEVLGDVRTLAEATDARDAGVDVVRDAAYRHDRVRLGVRDVVERPRVAVLEWLDPLWVGGHWVPQMVDYAGGEDVLGLAGEPSRRSSWEEVEAVWPEVVVVAPCGYGLAQAAEEAEARAGRLLGLGARRVVAVDASAYFSRPGPRLVTGVEVLAHVLYPERFPEAPAGAGAVAVGAVGR